MQAARIVCSAKSFGGFSAKKHNCFILCATRNHAFFLFFFDCHKETRAKISASIKRVLWPMRSRSCHNTHPTHFKLLPCMKIGILSRSFIFWLLLIVRLMIIHSILVYFSMNAAWKNTDALLFKRPLHRSRAGALSRRLAAPLRHVQSKHCLAGDHAR